MKSILLALSNLRSEWKECRDSKASTSRENTFVSTFTLKNSLFWPFKSLPNVRRLLIGNNVADPLFAYFEMSKKLNPELEFKDLSHKIKACNRYMRIMQYKLHKLLLQGDVNGYWILALNLMARSKVIRLLALRKLEKNWSTALSLPRVLVLLKVLDRKLKRCSTDLRIIRTYVDKIKPDGSKSWRPVGSPVLVDRMYSYIWQCFVLIFVGNYIDSDQHAYRPGKGVNTALASLRKYFTDKSYKFAWEFDLKGAFPSVRIRETLGEMEQRGLPKPIAMFLTNLTENVRERVDLAPQGQMLPEPKFDQLDYVSQRMEGINMSKLPAPTKEILLWNGKAHPGAYDSVEDWKDYFSNPQRAANFFWRWPNVLIQQSPVTLEELKEISPLHPMSVSTIDYFLHKQKERQSKYANTLDGNNFQPLGQLSGVGFPQGLGLSPILFNVAFDIAIVKEHFEKLGAKVISYADDFIVFSKKNIKDIYNIENHLGLVVNKEKSRLIKHKGKYQVPSFKFLGITIGLPKDSSEDVVVTGTPRSGKVLLMDPLRQDLVDLHERRDKDLRKLSSELGWDKSPEAILNAWGALEEPFCKLPLTFIDGTDSLTEKLVEHMKSTKDEPMPKKSQEDYHGGLHEAIESGSSLKFLRTRLSGLILSRLYSGDWLSSNEFDPESRVLTSDKADSLYKIRCNPFEKLYPILPKRGKGYRNFSTVSGLNWNKYTASSHATLDLLRLMDGSARYNKKLNILQYRA